MASDLDHLRAAIGREERLSQVCDPVSVARMAATLNRERPPQPGDLLPPLWHWIFFAPQAPTREIAIDGHPVKGSFLPDVPLPRRMWAGSRIRYRAPLRVGETAERISVIRDVQIKSGKSGALVFVTIQHTLSASGVLVVDEQQDIVYREKPGLSASPPSSAESVRDPPQFNREVVPDPVLLFRYSALTFNAHRIHYDRDYARRGEGYPGLVVHAPLTATLLVELLFAALPGVVVDAIRFRAVRPLFDLEPFHLHGRHDGSAALLWATAPDGELVLKMEVDLGEEHA